MSDCLLLASVDEDRDFDKDVVNRINGSVEKVDLEAVKKNPHRTRLEAKSNIKR